MIKTQRNSVSDFVLWISYFFVFRASNLGFPLCNLLLNSADDFRRNHSRFHDNAVCAKGNYFWRRIIVALVCEPEKRSASLEIFGNDRLQKIKTIVLRHN